jgi:hypothetical protein
MLPRTRSRSILQPQWFKWSKLRWLFSTLTLALAVVFLLLLGQAHWAYTTLGTSAAFRASVFHSFAPTLMWIGANVVLGLAATLWAWAAWGRERLFTP